MTAYKWRLRRKRAKAGSRKKAEKNRIQKKTRK